MSEFLELHCLETTAIVASISGDAARLDQDRGVREPLAAGSSIGVGDSIVVDAGAKVCVGPETFEGGARGRVFTFVHPSAVETAPSRRDVPRLIEDLERLEDQMHGHFGEDPLAGQKGPSTPFDHVIADDFAFKNLTSEAVRSLPESEARRLRAVCLFFHGEAACVAMPQLTVTHLREVMQVLGRPVNPHLVSEATIERLLERAYDSPAAARRTS